jgi:hypothetical protein
MATEDKGPLDLRALIRFILRIPQKWEKELLVLRIPQKREKDLLVLRIPQKREKELLVLRSLGEGEVL